MPQVAQDKRCFPLNKETVKKKKPLYVSRCVRLWADAHACVGVRACLDASGS